MKHAPMDADDVPPPPKPSRNRDNSTGDLFSAPYSNNSTSKAAAKDINPSTLKQRRRAVLIVIESAGGNGYTAFEIADLIGCPQHWVTSSIDALKKERMIEESGRSRTNPNSGKPCRVLVASQFAHGSLEEPAA